MEGIVFLAWAIDAGCVEDRFVGDCIGMKGHFGMFIRLIGLGGVAGEISEKVGGCVGFS